MYAYKRIIAASGGLRPRRKEVEGMDIITRMNEWEDRHPVLAGLVKVICAGFGIWLAIFGAHLINAVWPL